MRKFFLITFCLILIGAVTLGIVFHFHSDVILDRGMRAALDHDITKRVMKSVGMEHPSFRSVKRTGFSAVTWYDCSADIDVKHSGVFAANRYLSLRALEIIVSVDNVLEGALLLDAKKITVIWDDTSGESVDWFEGDELKIIFRLDVFDLEGTIAQFQDLSRDLAKLFKEGRCSSYIYFAGNIVFSAEGMDFTANVRTVREAGETIITMDAADVRAISESFDFNKPLTDAEIELLRYYPMRAEKLLRIKDRAEDVSAAANRNDPAVPEDAYRHVLWSYILTRAYGPAFAEKVTDAHEIGDDENTPAEHRMDYNNNDVGRRYAQAGYAESSILPRLLRDSSVMRTPR